MDNNLWWEMFCRTGNPEAYLLYNEHKEEAPDEHDKNNGVYNTSDNGGGLQ